LLREPRLVGRAENERGGEHWPPPRVVAVDSSAALAAVKIDRFGLATGAARGVKLGRRFGRNSKGNKPVTFYLLTR